MGDEVAWDVHAAICRDGAAGEDWHPALHVGACVARILANSTLRSSQSCVHCALCSVSVLFGAFTRSSAPGACLAACCRLCCWLPLSQPGLLPASCWWQHMSRVGVAAADEAQSQCGSRPAFLPRLCFLSAIPLTMCVAFMRYLSVVSSQAAALLSTHLLSASASPSSTQQGSLVQQLLWPSSSPSPSHAHSHSLHTSCNYPPSFTGCLALQVLLGFPQVSEAEGS